MNPVTTGQESRTSKGLVNSSKHTLFGRIFTGMAFLVLVAPSSPFANWLPSGGAAAADNIWRNPMYLNCSDTFWGCTENGNPGNQATEDDPYCEPCTRAWDGIEDPQMNIPPSGILTFDPVPSSNFFDMLLAQEASAAEAKEECYALAQANYTGGATLGALASAVVIYSGGTLTPLGVLLGVAAISDTLEGGLITLYCRIKHD